MSWSQRLVHAFGLKKKADPLVNFRGDGAEDRIQNTKIEDLHNLGISLRSLKKTLQKLDPNNSLLKEEIKKGQVSAENINEEIVEMINLK